MSKKLYANAQWKAHVRRRQRAQLKASRGRRRSARQAHAARFGRPRGLAELRIKVPAVFSIRKDPERMVSFIGNLRQHLGRRRVFLDMSDVQDVTPEAVVTLIALIHGSHRFKVGGNLPSSEGARRLIEESGFFDHVKSRRPRPTHPSGRIRRRHSTRVEPLTAKELIHFGIEAAQRHETCNKPCYRALIECMANTHNHAAGREAEGEAPWWAIAVGDPQSGRISFGFSDTGIGIFQSVRLRGLRRFYKALRVTDNTRILRDILQGKVESSTGELYRGKGLPKIFRDHQMGKIRSLYIIANDVFADVDADDFRLLKCKFKGTILCWEV